MKFNYYDLIRFEIADNFKWAHDWIECLGDVIKTCKIWNGDSDLIVKNFNDFFDDNVSCKQINNTNLIIYDEKYKAIIDTRIIDCIKFYSKHPCLEWIMWLLQLSFLNSKASLVHTAALSISNKCVLFQAKGGVGKTTITSALLCKEDYSLLGDDYIVIGEDGMCFPFLKPFVLYPYHKIIIKGISNNYQKPIMPSWFVNAFPLPVKLLKSILMPFPNVLQFARRHNPQSKRVNPSKIFENKKLQNDPTRLGIVVNLLKTEENFRMEEINLEYSVSFCIGNTLMDFDNRCTNIIFNEIANGSKFSERIFQLWYQIIKQAYKNAKHYIIYIPYKINILDIITKINSLIKAEIA